MPSKRSRTGRPARPTTSYAEWKDRAEVELERRHGVKLPANYAERNYLVRLYRPRAEILNGTNFRRRCLSLMTLASKASLLLAH
jgi:hypothetical protein